MKIEVLGTGCAKCRKLHQLVEQVVGEAGVDAEVLKVEELEEMGLKFMRNPDGSLFL